MHFAWELLEQHLNVPEPRASMVRERYWGSKAHQASLFIPLQIHDEPILNLRWGTGTVRWCSHLPKVALKQADTCVIGVGVLVQSFGSQLMCGRIHVYTDKLPTFLQRTELVLNLCPITTGMQVR